MSGKRKHEWKEKLDSCYNVVTQSSEGISASDIATILGKHRTTIHEWLNSLELMGKVYNQNGLWFANKEARKIKEKPTDIPGIFLKRIFDQTDEVKKILFDEENPVEAFGRMMFLIATLDEPMKEKIEADQNKIIDELNEEIQAKSFLQYFTLGGERAYHDIYRRKTIALLSKMYSLIYEKYPVKDLIGMKVEGVES